jgi:AcrR family transcriptional regulator
MAPVVRKPYAVGVARREEILQTALELFGARGYRGASLRDVASQVGLSMAGVLHYFPSKEALLAAVLLRRDDTDTPWFEERWAETGSFRQAFLDLMARNMAVPGVVRLFVTLAAEATNPEHPAHDFFEQRYRTSRALFARVVGEAQQRGEIDSAVSGTQLIAILDGFQVQWLIDPTFDVLGELDRYLDTITTGR